VSTKTRAKARHIPQRTCVGCRETSAKRQFVRVVRTPAGNVEVDATGKKSGRGAYLCPRPECWEEALRKDRLARALRTTLSQPDRVMLREYGGNLAATAAAARGH
jgi:predicted RNA-binding protein YlxR (DUF448 family)